MVRLPLGRPPVCARDKPGFSPYFTQWKPGLSQGQTRVFSLFYTVEARFVPGTNPVCPWDKPVTKGDRKSLCIKRLCAFFARQKERGARTHSTAQHSTAQHSTAQNSTAQHSARTHASTHARTKARTCGKHTSMHARRKMHTQIVRTKPPTQVKPQIVLQGAFKRKNLRELLARFKGV